ncbi:hypothetical protein N658DRAFT_486859 [Parathielavia hyrcaniae]|uniref:Uncharacterized protein n=1 Tax=Parathielavia hyrcaniae TaxID=113614 RepID=A0AAN6PZ14_9PEZI|nr:hypothetical protein N658DRAFT_486859 [Parathielavia hyrcaniae]
MGNSRVTAHFWRHKCPAKSPEDGDDVAWNHPNIKYSEISLLDRMSSKRGESLLGTKCSADGCQYVVNEETVVLNKYKEEIHNLGGKNLYPARLIMVSMRCCKWWCHNNGTYGHHVENSTFSGLGHHTCAHAHAYKDAIHEKNIDSRLPGCTCVMLNTYHEPIETWEPQYRKGVPCPGGPSDLDIRYREKRKQKGGEEMLESEPAE